MMGMRGYDIQPFNQIISKRMLNERLIEMGKENEVKEMTDVELLNIIENYRNANFLNLIPDEEKPKILKEGKSALSTVFERHGDEDEEISTLVFVSNEEGLVSKDSIVSIMNNLLSVIVENKTNRTSRDAFKRENKVNAIFILSHGISSFSKTYMNEMPTIKILTETEVLNRSYDQCLQSHVKFVGPDEKTEILNPVGLSGSKIPAVSKNNDVLCKVLDPSKGDLMIVTRTAIAPEEALKQTLFFRDVR